MLTIVWSVGVTEDDLKVTEVAPVTAVLVPLRAAEVICIDTQFGVRRITKREAESFAAVVVERHVPAFQSIELHALRLARQLVPPRCPSRRQSITREQLRQSNCQQYDVTTLHIKTM